LFCWNSFTASPRSNRALHITAT